MTNRREMLRTSLRVGSLGAAATLAAILGLRSWRNKECLKTGPCGGCPLLAGCELRKDGLARQAETNANYHE